MRELDDNEAVFSKSVVRSTLRLGEQHLAPLP